MEFRNKKGLLPIMLIFIFVFFLILGISQRVYSRSRIEEPFRKSFIKSSSSGSKVVEKGINTIKLEFADK